MSALTLYHGTLASLVPPIMERGLEPRGERKSHDEYMNSASMPKFVYLTSNFAYALEHACRISERTADGEPVAVVEVQIASLNRKLIYADEDYLRSEWNSDFVDWTLKEQLAYMEKHRDDWKESLKLYKTIAYRGVVPATALTEVVVKPWMEQGMRRKFLRKVAL